MPAFTNFVDVNNYKQTLSTLINKVSKGHFKVAELFSTLTANIESKMRTKILDEHLPLWYLRKYAQYSREKTYFFHQYKYIFLIDTQTHNQYYKYKSCFNILVNK